ncbi:MAG TPA: penicillin acylase family protein [Gammaproteobacteria bacterium]
MKLLATIPSVVAICVASVVFVALRGSLPILDGTIPISGLSADVIIDRDDYGVPTVRGSNRLDVARATGFLHAQDRFFQMDLMRRVAAGELSELVGRNALDLDREHRIHRLRSAAHTKLAELDAREGALLEAYAEGVNAGLQALRAVPFEYILLRVRPQRWLPEDTLLVNYAMYFQLNDSDASRDDVYATLRDGLPLPLREFMLNDGTEWDAPLLGTPIAVPPPPGPEVCDLRTQLSRRLVDRVPLYLADPERLAGSNAWAVSASRSSTGRAIVANDMHLDLGVPNIWYRMRFVVDSGEPLDVTGVTLPGAPAIVAGSNGHVAWGFTNSRGDWSDLVLLRTDPGNMGAYLTPDGSRLFEIHTEVIDVARAPTVALDVRSTIWGPVVQSDRQGRPRALHWLAHEPEASNLKILDFERARDVREAIDIAHTVGSPPQNIIIADGVGNIAWTIMGRIPLRAGYDPRAPADWAEEGKGWQGWLEPADYPVVMNPDNGVVWSANARVVDGEALDHIGTGGYALGARAKQIRDALLRLDNATIEDMLAIQLDDRALLLDRWRELLLRVLAPAAIAGEPMRAAMRREVTRWNGRADPDAAGYRLVREFRERVSDELLSEIVSGCGDFQEPIVLDRGEQAEGPVWRLVSEQPLNLLPPAYDSWSELLLAASDRAAASCGEVPLEQCTWGEINRLEIAHPLADALPVLSPWLTVHDGAVPGGEHSPRLQSGKHGASERFAVSPGDEENGYFHMPGGQSGHPLSPYFSKGHEAWVDGIALPFLPGETRHSLTLVAGE